MNVRRFLELVGVGAIGVVATSFYHLGVERQHQEEQAIRDQQVLPLRMREVGRGLREFAQAIGNCGRERTMESARTTFLKGLQCSDTIFQNCDYLPPELNQTIIRYYGTSADCFLENLEGIHGEGVNGEELSYYPQSLKWAEKYLHIAAEQGSQSDDVVDFYAAREAELGKEFVTQVVLGE